MNDREFLTAFRDGTLLPEEFRHLGHLRLAWLVVREHGSEEAIKNISAGIRHYASLRGAGAMYNETLTQFWIKIVNHAHQTSPSLQGFEQFIEAFPFLLNKQLPFRHWRAETLNGNLSRSRWLEPDLMPLPF